MMLRHNKFFLIFKQSKKNSQEIVAKSYHSFSVLHSLGSFFQVIGSEIFIASHDSVCHQIKISAQRTGSFFTDSAMLMQAVPRLLYRRISSNISNQFAFTFKSINSPDLSKKVRCCSITDTFVENIHIILAGFTNSINKAIRQLIHFLHQKQQHFHVMLDNLFDLGRTFTNRLLSHVVIHVILVLIFRDIWVIKQHKFGDYGF